MSQQLHRPSRSLEVLTMYEPHRLHQQFLQAAYALVVPVSCRRLTTVYQRVPSPESRNQCWERAEKGARDE